MGVAYFLLDTEDKKRAVGPHALAHGYKRDECWHSDEKNLKMIQFLNKKYGGSWKLVSEDDVEDGVVLEKNLGYRKDVRSYACEIGMTSWNALRLEDIRERESKMDTTLPFPRRYIKAIGKDEEEDLKLKYTSMHDLSDEQWKWRLLREFTSISVCSKIEEFIKEGGEGGLDRKEIVVRLVKYINELLSPLIRKKKVNGVSKKKRTRLRHVIRLRHLIEHFPEVEESGLIVHDPENGIDLRDVCTAFKEADVEYSSNWNSANESISDVEDEGGEVPYISFGPADVFEVKAKPNGKRKRSSEGHVKEEKTTGSSH